MKFPAARSLLTSPLSRLGLLLAGVVAATAAERDTRMAAPTNAVVQPLPGLPPTPAHEAAKTFRTQDGFRMELIAAEPLVASPVAMVYDENGRAYVCEMRDYPYTDKAMHQPNQENPTDAPIGRVRLLEDTDGDGRFDRATVFADGLSWPTGIACWRGGVFVAATPDLWYLKDTDGDGVADERRKVLTGFRKYNVQAVINSLAWGLDNHLHGAGSSNGGQIRPGGQPDVKPIVMSRHDFRFHPLTETFELLSGGARYGGSFDDWGNRFLCNIRNPVQHVVLPAHYLARNPFLATRSPIHDAAPAGDQLPVHRISPFEPWRELRAKRWAGERDMVMPRSELVAGGVFTSTSGLTIYRGTAYPRKFHGSAIVGEVANNVIHAGQLTPDGATFKATPLYRHVEFVASTDTWFRPVFFVNAPDGTLTVVDMYRENIEHPWSIPEDIHAAVDLTKGREMGRLWRLAPSGFKPSPPPRLGDATTAELVAALSHPDAWWRETAQRLLFEQQDTGAIPGLRAVVQTGKLPQARLHALWLMHNLGSLSNEDVLAGLRDPRPEIRENAVRLAERQATSGLSRRHDAITAHGTSKPLNLNRARTEEHLIERLLALADDPDPRVRFQLAFTLGELRDPRALQALADIARRDTADPWTRTAVLSSVANTSDQLLARLVSDARFAIRPEARELIRELARIIGVRGKTAEIETVLLALTPGDVRHTGPLNDVVTGIGDGFKRSGRSLRHAGLTGNAAQVVETLLSNAARTAMDTDAPATARVAAVPWLTYEEFSRAKPTLTQLLMPSQPQEVQRATIHATGSFTAPETAPMLLAHWRAQTPAIRTEVINAMLAGRSRVLPLLQAVESGLIPASQIPFAKRATLLRSTDAKVKELAAKFFSDSAATPRKEVVARYQAALGLQGDVTRGRAVFEAACASCHRAGTLGKDVGPDLATIRGWNPEQILLNILDPNREVSPNFLSYTIETTDGRTLDGIITEEGASSLTLRRADGVSETLLRRDIASLTGSGMSLMPEGLENAITVAQMSDLITFLLATP